MIQIENLSFQYKAGKKAALENINLTIHKGDFVGVIGESGAGKSTLAYAINGIIPHHYKGDYYGSVKVKGLDTFELEPSELALHVGSVFQDVDSQMVATVVEDELLFGLENFGVSKDEIENRIQETLEMIGISDLRHRKINSLSGGQKQKVAIAAIIALRPDILVLDEPTGELDPKASVQIFRLLKKLNEEQGMTIVMIEQKIMLLCEYVNRLLVMNHGKLVYDDQVMEVLQYSEQLGELGINCPRVVTLCNELTKSGVNDGTICVSTKDTANLIKEFLPENYSRSDLGIIENIEEATGSNMDSETVISFENVCFAYDKKPTLRNLNFSIKQGEFVAIVGTNGAGKSTMSRMVNGLLKPMEGSVTVKGMDTRKTKTSVLAKCVGFLFQNPDRQICQNTVREEILFGLKCIYKDEELIAKRLEKVLELFDLDEKKDPFSLSRGERQRVALASLIALEPEILILDEPTTGLDYRECMDIMAEIKKLNQKGITVVMVCHDMEVVLDFADRVMVMHEGQMRADNRTKTIFSDNEVLQEASLLPPQIAGVSLELGSGWNHIFDTSQMVKAVLSVRQSKGGKA